jgi:putative lipoic acid-binding regulatory protein
MVLDKNTKEKPEINYPTKWGFKVMGKDKAKIEAAVKEVMGDKSHKCHFSKTSKNGKFSSYNAECIVESQEERDALYKAFGDHCDIDYAL